MRMSPSAITRLRKGKDMWVITTSGFVRPTFEDSAIQSGNRRQIALLCEEFFSYPDCKGANPFPNKTHHHTSRFRHTSHLAILRRCTALSCDPNWLYQ